MDGAALASFLFPIIIPSLSSSKRLLCHATCRLLPLAVAVPPVAVVVQRRRATLSCRLSPSSACCLSPSSCRVAEPPVAVVVSPVALLPLAIVVSPVAVVVPRHRAARRLLCSLAANRRNWTLPRHSGVAHDVYITWSKCPWMCQTRADGVNTTTSMTMMSTCRKYHGCVRLWMEVPYPTVAYC